VPDRASRRPTSHPARPDEVVLNADASREIASTVEPQLAGDERLLVHLRGIGASMFVTTERIILARDGRDRRPRSGLQSFSLEKITSIRLEPGASPSGRIVVSVGPQEAASMFFVARARDRAQEAVDAARPLIARRRREREAITRRTSS
jgi:hypothetical protein